ncbi:MAG: glycosyltransferase [Bacillota bacterium]
MAAVMPVRILLTTMALELGGAETHVVSLAAALRERGHQVVVASAGGSLVDRLGQAGVPHELVPLHSRHPLHLLRGARGLRRLMDRFPPDVVHAHARIPAFLCDLVRGPVPLVTTYHGIYAAGFPWSLVTRAGDLTIAVSEDVRRYICQRFRVDPGRVLVIPNGIDVSAFRPGLDPSPVRLRAGLSPGDIAILHAGRLERDVVAGTLTVLKAAPAFLADPRVSLLVLGDGPERERVLAEMDRVNREVGRPAVRWMGRQEEMPRWYSLAALVLGSGRVALEAMACARPVIIVGGQGSERARGLAEVAGLAEPAACEDLMATNFCARGYGHLDPLTTVVRGVRSVLENAELAARLGREGRALVESRYSLAVVSTRVEETYLRAVRTRRT